MKKIILSSLAFALFSTTVSSKEVSVDLDKIKREINIMSNILKASFAEDKSLGLRNIESQYLVSQGITFKLDARSFGKNSFSWSNILPVAPVAPIDFDFDEAQIEEIREQALSISREAYSSALEAIAETSEHIRELAERERDVDHEIRSTERESRDINFEKRNADKSDVKELEVRKKQLDVQVKELKAQKEQLDSKQQKLRKTMRDKKTENKAKAQEKKRLALTNIKKTLSMSLCDYGAGLRNLPNSESVNFVLKNAGDNRSDVIYIFTKKDIKSCVIGNIDAVQLLSKSVNYHF